MAFWELQDPVASAMWFVRAERCLDSAILMLLHYSASTGIVSGSSLGSSATKVKASDFLRSISAIDGYADGDLGC